MSRILEFFKTNAKDIVKTLPSPYYYPTLDGKDGELNQYIIEKLAYLQLNEGATREPFPGQVEYVIAPIMKLLEKERVGIIVGKQGTGKTTMANSIAYLLYKKNYEPKNKGFKTGMFVSGSKHMKKMRREAISLFGRSVDVFSVVSKPRKTVSWEISIEEAARMPRVPGRISYFLISKDTGKNTYKFRPMRPGQKCPECNNVLRAGRRKKTEAWFCHNCNAKTYQVESGKESYPDKLKRLQKNKHDKFFDFFIIDEVHEFANRDSLQSKYYKAIVNVSYKSVVMTGTLSNGYASSIFYILYPLFAKHFKKYGGFTYEKVASFVNLFGSIKEETTVKVTNGVQGRPNVSIQELPQISDRIISFLAPYTVWFDISDLNVDMPNFREIQRIVPLNEEITTRFNEWKSRILGVNEHENMYQFNSSLSYRINNPTKRYVHTTEEFSYINQVTGDVVYVRPREVEFDALPEESLFNKEKELIDICKSELSEERRVLVYGVYNNSTEIYSRLKLVLDREGIHSEITPSSLKAEDLEEWLRSPDRANVVFVPQKRVATGLDLVEYHTVIFYEIDKELKTVSQAKVRPWRPVGQTKEVRVYYLAYEGKQAEALQRMAQKMRAAAVVDGEVIENDTIAAIYDYNPELTAAIKNITQTINSMESSVLKRKHSELEQKYIDMVNDCHERLKNGEIVDIVSAKEQEAHEEDHKIEEIVETQEVVIKKSSKRRRPAKRVKTILKQVQPLSCVDLVPSIDFSDKEVCTCVNTENHKISVEPISELLNVIDSSVKEIEAENTKIEIVVEKTGQQAWAF